MRIIIAIIFPALFFVGSSCNKGNSLFQQVSSSQSNIEFINKLPQRPNFNILYYLYYYAGGGVSVGDINNDGLTDLYFTANSKGGNKLYLNKGNFQFEDITDNAGVAGTADWCSGVTMADVNADGWLDIYVCAVSGKFGLTGHNELFINNHDGTFTDRSAGYGLDIASYAVQAAFFDYDHDGDLDCFITNESDRPNQNIVDTSHRRKYDAQAGDRLLRNDLNLPVRKYTDVSANAGIYQSNLGYGLGLAIGDLNNDGWDDIYVGNDFHENDYYYVNNKDGSFSESGEKHFNHYSRFSMGNDIADYNNDGQLDVVTADMLPQDEKVLKTYGSDESLDIYNYKIISNGFQPQYSKNCLQRNNGDGSSFSETALLSGVAATDWSWCPLFADFDNDGNKDLFITSGILKRTTDLDYVKFISNAYTQKQLNTSADLDETALSKMPDGISHSFIYKGDGQLSFTDMSQNWGFEKYKGYFNGAAYADLDNDGDLDLVVNALNAKAQVYQNTSSNTNFLSVSCVGNNANTSGVGAKAYLFTKNKVQYQQLNPTRGFQSCSDQRLHFGLGNATLIDSLLIVWPDQTMQSLKKVATNQQLKVYQKSSEGSFDQHHYFANPSSLLTDVTDSALIRWSHKEDNFADFNVQYLIPHAQSTRGPKIATGDVNKDGLDDFFICGAKGQRGSLMVQQKNGTFTEADTIVFNTDAGCEDVDAVFFDANNDGNKDLYVVSGGNEFSGNNPVLLDRLYLNDGKGHFSRSINCLPSIFQNKSCVTVADIDKDGDQDIFVGTLANAKAYGELQTSYLLINDGTAHFSIAGQSVAPLTGVGMVTSAVFTDINKDGYSDLLVTGEWMPLTIYINKGGRFDKSIIPNSTGLWQTLFAEDVNNDGNLDILAGNWGWNNKFWSGKKPPLQLYVADFDKNGNTDQLISYNEDGVEYPFLAKDEVEKSLPLLKKHYLLYTEYAGVPMKDVFYGWIDTIKPLMAERLGSVVCYGDGKGSFSINDLPEALQLAPVFSFQKISNAVAGNQFLAGGNFFDVLPYEGRYDAQSLAMFNIAADKHVTVIPQPDLSSVKGQIRDIKWLNEKDRSYLLVARNNARLLAFRKNN